MNGPTELNERDKRIVDLIVQGYTVPQIAEELGYSPQSVKTYKKRIYGLLRVHDKKGLYEKINGNKE